VLDFVAVAIRQSQNECPAQHQPNINLGTTAEHALEYLRRADSIPRRVEGEAALLEFLPTRAKRILELGSGAGRLLGLVSVARPETNFVALDFSATMLEALHDRFARPTPA